VKKLNVLIIATLIVLGGCEMKGSVVTKPTAPAMPAVPPEPSSARFVLVSTEDHGEADVEVWHDTVTRQEIVCFYSKLAVPSCVITRTLPE
jgi:hypothetical protein